MAMTLCELKWIVALLAPLGVRPIAPIPFFYDNQAAIHIAANPVLYERTKHIEVDCHFVHDTVRDVIIVTRYVKTTEQIAYMFTKALG